MSNKGQLLQDPFLNALRREHVPVSIYLVNGIKLQGQVESFDQYVVLLKNTVTQMVLQARDLHRGSGAPGQPSARTGGRVIVFCPKARRFGGPVIPHFGNFHD